MRKKMAKRMLALLLSAVTILSLTVGCGKTEGKSEEVATEKVEAEATEEAVEEVSADKDNGEQYDVNIIYRIAPQDEAATQAVLDYINNDILPDLLPNTTISFTFIPASEYVEQIKLKSAAGEKMDLMLSMASYGFTDFAAQSAFLPWNEYLELMPNTKEVIPEEWFEGTTINGEIYGIPNYQITARSYAICIDKDMAEKYNVDIDQINSMEDLETLCLKPMKEGGEYKNGSIVRYPVGVWTNSQAEAFDLAGLEQISGMLVVEKDNPNVIKNMFETDGISNNLALVRHWTEEGYYSFDNIDGIDEATQMTQNLVGVRLDGYQPYWDAHLKTAYDRDFLVKTITEPLVTTASVRSTMTALSYTSENPYRAAKVYDLINSNEELFNAICYGIEGVNYNWNDDGTVSTVADSGYAIHNWSYQYGNTMNQYRLSGKQEDYTKLVDDLNRSASTSNTFGFAFDGTNVVTEVASCNAILDLYKDGLNNGKYEDVQATLDQMNEELYAAGLQKIIDEAQAQMDAWVASK